MLSSAGKPSLPSAVEHRPADLVTQPLVVQHEIADLFWEQLALPAALLPTGTLGLAFRSTGPYRLDRVGGSTELMSRNVSNRRRLAGGERRVPRGTGQLSGGGIRLALPRA